MAKQRPKSMTGNPDTKIKDIQRLCKWVLRENRDPPLSVWKQRIYSEILMKCKVYNRLSMGTATAQKQPETHANQANVTINNANRKD